MNTNATRVETGTDNYRRSYVRYFIGGMFPAPYMVTDFTGTKPEVTYVATKREGIAAMDLIARSAGAR